MSNDIKTVSSGEISNFAYSMVQVLDHYLVSIHDTKLYTVTKLNECKYTKEDFIDEFESIEDFKIDIKYFDNPDLDFYDIAKNILLESLDINKKEL